HSPMKLPVQTLALVALTAAGTAAIAIPVATAQSGDASASVSAPASAPLVTGLPDFTRLVDRVAPAVVNVEVTLGARGNPQAQAFLDEMPEFFHRFFGPGTPFPGPQGPGGPGPARM